MAEASSTRSAMPSAPAAPAPPYGDLSLPERVTPELLLTSAYRRGYELIGGRLVEKTGDAESSLTTTQIVLLLGLYLRDRRLGYLFDGNAGYQCFDAAPDDVRKSDLSFVRACRFPNDVVPDGHIRIAPDLAIEVVSSRDNAGEIEAKIQEHLRAGVRLIWIVYPGTRHVRVRRPAGAAAGPGVELAAADTITGEDVIPGFTCKVDEFF